MKLITKKSYKKNYQAQGMFAVGVLVFLLSNTYFGWNKEPQSGWERVFDFVWQGLVMVGFIDMWMYRTAKDFFMDDMRIELEVKE